MVVREKVQVHFNNFDFIETEAVLRYKKVGDENLPELVQIVLEENHLPVSDVAFLERNIRTIVLPFKNGHIGFSLWRSPEYKTFVKNVMEDASNA